MIFSFSRVSIPTKANNLKTKLLSILKLKLINESLNLSYIMNFQKFLFNEALEEDGLVIMAKGLGLHKILVNTHTFKLIFMA